MLRIMAPRDPTKELIEKAQAGDRQALEALVLRYRDQLDHFVRLRLGTHLRQKVEVDDVLQETFARSFQSVEQFMWRTEESFLKWLKGIAERVILKLARCDRRDQVLFVQKEKGEAVISAGVSPSRTVRRHERFDRLQEALDGLSPEYREVIVLARLKGLRSDEIAKRMNRSATAVRHLLLRALTKLKENFGDTESFHLPMVRLDEGEPDDDR